jgi:hypothetical protein
VQEAEWDKPLVSEGDLSPVEIMEATATLHEASLLHSKHITSAVIREWKPQSLHGIYNVAYTWFGDRFGHTRRGKRR